MKEETPQTVSDGSILTRIYITPSGDLVVTELWQEIEELLQQQGGFGEDQDL